MAFSIARSRLLAPRLPAGSYRPLSASSAPSFATYGQRFQISTIQRRGFFFGSAARQNAEVDPAGESLKAQAKSMEELTKSFDENWDIIYTSPLSTAYKRLKHFSVASAIIGSLSGPVLATMEPSMPLAPRLVLAGAVVSVSVGTTVFLTFLAKPYVIRVMQNKKNPNLLQFTTLNVLAREVHHELELGEITRKPTRPILSNMHVPRLQRDFYIHDTMAPEFMHGLFPEAREAAEEDLQENDPAKAKKAPRSKKAQKSFVDDLDFDEEIIEEKK